MGSEVLDQSVVLQNASATQRQTPYYMLDTVFFRNRKAQSRSLEHPIFVYARVVMSDVGSQQPSSQVQARVANRSQWLKRSYYHDRSVLVCTMK